MDNEEENKANLEEYVNTETKEKKHKLSEGTLIMFLVLGIFLLILTIYGYIVGLYDTTIDKPIIYLYPQEETEISVKLGNPEILKCSYPKYENSWEVIAYPDGTLKDTKTRKNVIFIILGRERY